jgi:hypothetical protein
VARETRHAFAGVDMIEISSRNALELGRAGEHLVVADLILSGYSACLAEQGMPYDIILDHDGNPVRVQVKSTVYPGNVNKFGEVERIAYTWNIRKRGKDRKGERLSEKHCDIVAAVALDIRKIAYLPVSVCGTTLQLSPPGAELMTRFKSGFQWGRCIDEFHISEALCGDLTVYRSARRQRTHCIHGHELTEESTRVLKNGCLACRECERRNGRENARKRRMNQKEELRAAA